MIITGRMGLSVDEVSCKGVTLFHTEKNSWSIGANF